MGVEVTWGERTKSTSFKSKTYEQRDTESPPTKVFVDEPTSESPKGLFKFLLGWERRGVSSPIENDFQSLSDETTSALNVERNGANSHISTTNDSTFYTAKEKVEETKSEIRNSPNLKHLLNDSEDMDLILCSQRVEQEVCSSTKSVIAIASKGFSAAFSDDDGKHFLSFTFELNLLIILTLPTDDLLLANLDDPFLVDKKMPQKSIFARHKSIAIQPNSSITAGATASILNSNTSARIVETKSNNIIQPVNKIETPTASATATSTTPSKSILVRHKSMPSPNRKFESFSS